MFINFFPPSTPPSSNYTLQVMPLPLHDISKAGKVEHAVQRIQLYLCRNHSDERLKVELAARHRYRLLTATQQSVSSKVTLAQGVRLKTE